MSGGLNRQFLDDPKGFMRSHILEMSTHNLPGKNNAVPHVLNFNMKPLVSPTFGPQRVAVEAHANDPHGVNSHPITAFWLPYVANSYCQTVLDHNQAEFMFTETLTGCTVGIGSGANPQVSHINYQTPTHVDHDRILQKFNRKYMFDVDAHAIHQADYWDPNPIIQRYTLVGIYSGGTWKFYMNGRQNSGKHGIQLYGSRKFH